MTSTPYALSLLQRAYIDNPAEASRIYSEKIQRRPFPLRPTEPSTSSSSATAAKPPTQSSSTNPEQKTKLNARDVRRIAREIKYARRYTSHKPKPMSAKERRARGLHEIPKECRRYDLYEGLHTLWLGYMQEILAGTLSPALSTDYNNNNNKNTKGNGGGGKQSIVGSENKTANQGTAARISAADLHGALMTVVRSRCPSRVGIKGIMVKETKMTFFIVTKKNEVKSVPKEHSVFRFEVPWPATTTSVLRMDAGGGGGAAVGSTSIPVKTVTKNKSSTLGGDIEMVDAGEGEGSSATKEGVVMRPMVFELHGSNFLHRSSERANKKWKAKPMTEL